MTRVVGNDIDTYGADAHVALMLAGVVLTFPGFYLAGQIMPLLARLLELGGPF